MRVSSHPLRFAYALFFLYGLIARTHYYPSLYIALAFSLWITYELIWSYLLDTNYLVVGVAIVLGIITAYGVYNFSVCWIPVIAIYLAFGIYLNVVSMMTKPSKT